LAGNVIWISGSTAFAGALLISLVLTPLVRRWAMRWRLGDKPNGRKVHKRVIPHLGGVALVAATVVGVALSALPGANSLRWGDFALRALPALALVVAIGLVDDTRNLRALQKLVVQVLAGALLALSGFHLLLGVPLLDASPTLVAALSVLFFVGMSSAVNLIDGHDGLAAGVSTIAAATFGVMAVVAGSPTVVVLALVVMGACLGFLAFNFPPGRIYMGDTGSMFLGTVLAVMACLLTMSDPRPATFVAVCFALGIPMLDVALAIARRFAMRSPLFRADSLHMHHVLLQAGFTPRQILVILYSMQALLCVLGFGVSRGLVLPAIVGVALIAGAFVSFLRMMVASQAVGGRAASDIAPSSIPLKRNLQGNVPTQRSSVGR
jgi:UDP-GlcNAc:undecaprenyl-phosphate GlcNAc-1-phosphate transferase